MANYRIKPLLSSNLPQGLLLAGRFTLSTAGAVGTLRPSAGASPAAGAGLLYTVTQVADAYGSTAANAYKVTLAEEYFKVVGAQANYCPAFSLTLGAVAVYDCQVSQYDSTSRSFMIYVLTKGTVGGAAAAPVRTENLAAGEIVFEVFAIPTVTQATT